LVYIAFLAFDAFTSTHAADPLGGVAKVPGDTDSDADSEKVASIAFKMIDDLINEAGTRIEDPEYSDVKTRAGEFVQEL
jgi:amyloid beta precursor protein binding protein 1